MPKPCPHPEKLWWPLDDEWGPWVRACEINRRAHVVGDGSVMQVYRCGGLTGDHWHLTDETKARAKHRAFLERTGRVLSHPTTNQSYQEVASDQDAEADRADSRAHRARRLRVRRAQGRRFRQPRTR